MLAIKEKAIGYINEMPDERLASALDYLRFLCEHKLPYEVTTKAKFFNKIDEGLADMKHGRMQPLDEAMWEIRQGLA